MSYVLDTPNQSFTIYTDSLNCVNRYPDFVYNLDTPIKVPLGLSAVLSVQNVTFANTFANITDSNNVLTFVILGSIEIVTIPEGIYNVGSFVNVFNSLSTSITARYDLTQYKIIFTCDDVFSLLNTGIFITSCGDVIGAPRQDNNSKEFTLTASTLAIGYQLIMPLSFDFTGYKYIGLKLDSITINNINTQGTLTNTLIRVPIISPIGQLNQYRPNEVLKFIFSRRSINSLTFRLQNLKGEILKPNQLQVVFKIDFIKTPDITEVMKGSIDYYYQEFGIPEREENINNGQLT